MLLGYPRFTLFRVALVVLAVGILPGCSERKPAGPPEGAAAIESQSGTSTATPIVPESESETETETDTK